MRRVKRSLPNSISIKVREEFTDPDKRHLPLSVSAAVQPTTMGGFGIYGNDVGS